MWPRIGPSLLLCAGVSLLSKTADIFCSNILFELLVDFLVRKLETLVAHERNCPTFLLCWKVVEEDVATFTNYELRHVLQTVLMKIFIFSFNLKSLINSLGQYWMENPWIFESYAYLLILWSWWHNFHQLSHFQYWWWTWTACRY